MPVMQHGKPYNTVQERLKAAHGDTAAPVGITSIFTEPISLPSPHGPAAVIKATVTFTDGRVFTGLAEVPFDAPSGAEKTNPWEVAETSAVGRCLAFAGYYGSDTGLAGAEEMREAQRRQGRPQPSGRTATAQIPPEIEDDTHRMTPPRDLYEETERTHRVTERAQNTDADDRWGNPPPTEPQQRALYALGKKTGAFIPKGLTRQAASELIGKLDSQAKAAQG